MSDVPSRNDSPPTQPVRLVDRRWLAPLLLLLLTLSVHSWDLTGDYVYDDVMYIVNNHAVQDGVADWPRFFTDGRTYGSAERTAHYRPLVAVSYAVNVSMGWGPLGFKLTQILLLYLTGLGFAWMLGRLRSAGPVAEQAIPSALPWAAAGVVVALPFNVEVAHYLTARSSLMCGLFAVLSIGCFAQFRRAKSPLHAGGFLLLHLVSLAAAATSKETGVALPLVVLMTDLVLIRPWVGRSVWSLKVWWPYTPYVIGGVLAWWKMPALQMVNQHLHTVFGSSGRTGAAFQALVENIRLMVIPTNLSITHAITDKGQLSDTASVTAMILMVLLVAVLFFCWRRAPLVAFGLGWYCLLIAPSTFVHLYEILQENRGFSSSFGIVMVACWLVIRWWPTAPDQRRLAGLAVGVVLVCHLAITMTHQRVWADERTLWTHALTVVPDSARAYTRLSTFYDDRGEYRKAAEHMQQALRLDPAWSSNWSVLGHYFEKLELYDAAEKSYKTGWMTRLTNRSTFSSLVLFLERNQRLESLIPVYTRALTVWPQKALDFHLSLASVYRRLGRLSEAEVELALVLEKRPDWNEAQLQQANLYYAAGRYDDAVAAYDRLIEGDPRSYEYWQGKGLAWLAAGEYQRAAELFAVATKRFYRSEDARFLWAEALRQDGQTAAATEQYRRFIERAGNMPEWAERVAEARTRLAGLTISTP